MSGGVIPAGAALAVAAIFMQQDAAAQTLPVDLFSASDFAVLAGSGITIAGAIDTTNIYGDIGSFAIPTITGLENVILNGVNHAGDAVTQQAKLDLAIAYLDAAGRTPTTIYGPAYDLGGLSLGAGVYNDPSSLFITGDLTLNGGGDPNAVWIFQAGSTLITSTGSNVFLIGGAQASNVFWQVGSSATLGVDSVFEGTILASQSITLNTGAEMQGRALARNGAVTMDSNTISIPEPSGMLLLGVGLVALVSLRRRSHR